MASIIRRGDAHWTGTGKEGKGHLSTPSGTLKDTPYAFNTRFADGIGTNPEELIAAAHAGCFTMALAFKLQEAGHTAESLETDAKLTMEQDGGGFTITTVALTLKAKVPGIDQAAFQALATDAEKTCPVSKVLNAKITLAATLA